MWLLSHFFNFGIEYLHTNKDINTQVLLLGCFTWVSRKLWLSSFFWNRHQRSTITSYSVIIAFQNRSYLDDCTIYSPQRVKAFDPSILSACSLNVMSRNKNTNISCTKIQKAEYTGCSPGSRATQNVKCFF